MGVNILERTSPASGGYQINTGALFLVGPMGAGPQTAPAECHDIADFESAVGTRTTAQPAWDYLDNFFHEGGNTAYVLDYLTAGQYTNALALLPASLGPGQVAVVGENAGAGLYAALQAHADANNRIALLDCLATDNSAVLMEANGTLAQALTSMENVGVFGSWVKIPAPNGVISGTTRQVPASSTIAALCNRVDQQIGRNGIANYNQPAGGRAFPLQYAQGFVFDPTLASDQSGLFAKGVNFFHDAWGTLENYGFVTPLYQGTPLTTTPFWQLNCSRARMWLKAQAQVIGEDYYMVDIDAEGVVAARLGADLANICYDLWQAGGLYGATADEAYNINVGVSVNNDGTAATGTLNAVAECKFSQYAQTVNITLVSVPVAGIVG